MTRMRMDDVAFGTAVRSPQGKDYTLTDSGTDTRGDFVWLTPIGPDGRPTGARRRKLYGEGEGWTIGDQVDVIENISAGQEPQFAEETSSMTDQTPAYWIVIYTADDWDGPLISSATWAKTPEEASHRVVNARQGRTAQNTVGPFTDQTEAESYRRTWARGQSQVTIAGLLTLTADLIQTNGLHTGPGWFAETAGISPAQSPLSVYGAMNVAFGADPDDTRGTRDGLTSADTARVFSEFLGTSALEWSQAPGRTPAEVTNALHACASAMLDAADRTKSSALPSPDPADDEEIVTGPGFPVACSQIHEHDEVACAPEPLVSNAGTAGTAETVWSVVAESFDGMDVPAETFVRISDMNALIIAHRAAGASVEVSWPFGSDGTESPTYVHIYVDGRGVVTFRRANKGEAPADKTETQS